MRERRPIKSTLGSTYRQTHNGNTLWQFSTWDLKAFFISVFLPQGYPSSVSDDYLDYQKWDTGQALMSSLTGALATEAVLTGAGVGRETSTALAAAMTWIVKDGLGMIGRIAFSYAKGSQLDNDCKRWRLVADVLNDAAFLVDLLNPALPGCFFFLACVSSSFRCIVGVAGGATRATIVQHQALRNNLGDVAAKDGSQETLVNMVAMMVSLVLLPAVSGNQPLIWSLFLLFTIGHIYFNYRAVKSLHFNTLNRERAVVVVRRFISTGKVPSVHETNELESLFPSGPRVHLGVFFGSFPPSGELYEVLGSHVICLKESEAWVTLADKPENRSENEIFGLFHAMVALEKRADLLDQFEDFLKLLKAAGFNVNENALGYGDYGYTSSHKKES